MAVVPKLSMDKRDVGIMAVTAVGAGMIILFLLAGITVAVGNSVPTEYWAAAGSLSGALVGLLAPQPATRGSLTRLAARMGAAVPGGAGGGAGGGGARGGGVPGSAPSEALAGAGVGRGVSPGWGAAPAPTQVDITEAAQTSYQVPAEQIPAFAAQTTRVEAVTQAAASAPSYDLRVIGLLVLGVAAFAVGVWLALTVGDHSPATASDTAVANAATALIALGSAAGGALVGLLSPTPGRSAA